MAAANAQLLWLISQKPENTWQKSLILEAAKTPPMSWVKAGKVFQGSTLPTPFVVQWFQLLFSILAYFLAPAATL